MQITPPKPLTATARLILQALANTTTSMTATDVAVATGSSALTVMRTLQLLTRSGMVTRIRVSQRAYYTLPTTTTQGQE